MLFFILDTIQKHLCALRRYMKRICVFDTPKKGDKMENKSNDAMNELNQKQIFIDLNTKSAETDTDDSTSTIVQGDLHQTTVFDEAYAAMKNSRQKEPSFHQEPVVRKRRTSGKSRFKPTKIWNTRLCSGELPADALRRIARELLVLVLFCFAVCFLFSVKGWIIARITDTDYSALARGTSYSAPVGSMEFDFSDTELQDGFAAAQAVCTQLNAPITDSAVFENNRRAPLYPGKILASMESALTKDNVTLKTNMSNLDLLVQIYQSLEHNTPVIVLLSEESGDTYTMQYAIVSHIDAEQNKITLCNPNSGTVDYTLEQFIAATRFENHKEKSIREHIALAVGSWARNTAIFVKNTNE